ncbi:DoxX family protein [Shewanella sp. C32]|uniref:DoxX family protein n=1 Tax=Shewanella electrica TaxID=515560 RepID=A0ABT2FGG0_9GAMM|nr:DoxX family protein [Shewanella electrica]MCH1923306.1 DoxX family protein [Shewanella electrica]MCS4555403.1 DoxX family protein [Shewanella electrica]
MKKFIHTLVQNNAGYAPLLLRVPVGLILMAHGSQKLFGLFGGYGLAATGQWMESIGITPGELMAFLAGSGEFFGGLFLVLGLLIRPAALVVAFTMLVALFTVHINNGLFMANNGYEYALSLAVIAGSLIISGAGKVSLDNWLAGKF